MCGLSIYKTGQHVDYLLLNRITNRVAYSAEGGPSEFSSNTLSVKVYQRNYRVQSYHETDSAHHDVFSDIFTLAESKTSDYTFTIRRSEKVKIIDTVSDVRNRVILCVIL